MVKSFRKHLILAISLIAVFVVFAKFGNNSEKQSENYVNREKRAAVESRAEGKKYMTFDDWSSGTFRSRSFYPNWISGDEYVAFSSGAIVKKSIVDGSTTSTLLPNGVWAGLSTAYDYSASPDEQYIAIFYDKSEDGYAHYMNLFSVAVYAAGGSTPTFTIENVQKFKWSPTGHKISYVKGFDVYMKKTVTDTAIQLTTDGKENVIFNGITDWLHYVEITDDDALLWWSPDSKYLTYAKLTQEGVTNFDFSRYVGDQYPPMIKFPYPKPGTKLPATTLYVVDTDSTTPENAKHFSPSQGVQDWNEYYLNSLMWRSNTDFVPTWKNRFENKTISDMCLATNVDSCDGSKKELVRSSESGWLGQYKPADLIRGGDDDEVITIYSHDNFPRVAVINLTSDTVSYRTDGNFEVASISFYDRYGDWVYYVSTELESLPGDGLPRIRHLWKVKGHGNGDNLNRKCITCQLNEDYKDRCNWVTPSFSTTGDYLVVNCGGTGNGIPISTSHKQNSEGNYDIVRIEEDNDRLNQTLNEYYYRERIYDFLELDNDPGTVYYYALHLPPNFNDTKTYPLFVQVYSAPGYQYVVDAYNADWARGYIASSDLDIVVMTFDGRGTGFRGDEIMHKVYRKLGQLEPVDQIDATKKVLDKHSYLDKNNVAVWGRSYGGYATTRIIQTDEDVVFKCGIAVAPVIDWMFYHTIYTERYMGSPYNDNELGYNLSTALQSYETIKKHKYYLVHGTSDENVHFQNAARMSMALIEHDVDFGAYFAGDEVHSFNRGSNSYNHHYKYLTTKLKDCFGIE